MSNNDKKTKKRGVFFTTRRTATRADLAAYSTRRNQDETSRAYTLRTNEHGQRAYRIDEDLHIQSQPTSSSSQPQLDFSSLGEQIDLPSLDQAQREKTRKKTKKNPPSSKLQEWLSFRQTSLDKLLRHDGLGDFLDRKECHSCQSGMGVFKCQDCFDGSLLRCRECAVTIHRFHPLHRIEHWNGSFFEKTTLQALGLRVQLGHAGEMCPFPSRGPVGFCVVDTSGIHPVSVDFCDCGTNNFTPSRIQILQAGWFPATFNRPKTVFTFNCLDSFHELTLQGKTTLYDFYHTILHKTDNWGLKKVPDQYHEFHRVMRIWRGLMMLKRSGRGQDPAGINAMSQGELAVECLACPHPGRNLPEGWETTYARPFLTTLFLACDANFKLKSKDRGVPDLELMPGWAYFVEENQYQAFIKEYIDESEINTCRSEHDALVRAATRCTPGYNVTGTALVMCARHCLVRKNGVGDLQKGERYCNVDYTVLSSLAGNVLPRVVLTYDIGCQYSRNFYRRMQAFPASMQISKDTKVEIGIPSWHINSHGPTCQSNFCLGYMEGVGRTCGEEVETSWAQTNALGTSTREMAPGARHETLNDQWGGFNFQKITGFCLTFLKKFNKACRMWDKHHDIFVKFTGTFNVKTIEKWEQMVLDWHNDVEPRSKLNPYEEPESATTLQDVRLQLAKEDADEAAQGVPVTHKMTLTSFVVMGLEIEEQQRQLNLDVPKLGKTLTSKQKAELDDRRAVLVQQIKQWQEVQLSYMPHVAGLRHETDDSVLAEAMPLYLPSSLPVELHKLESLAIVIQKEIRLRIAQADDALAGVRKQQRIISGLWEFKKLNVAGTGNKANTRMRSLYNRIQLQSQCCVLRYQAAYSALVVLDPEGSWKERLKVLNTKDVRGPGKTDDDQDGENWTGSNKKKKVFKSRGEYEMSWIWLVPRVSTAPDMGVTEEALDENMRIEWVKCRARNQRWEEEVHLLEEEMRRVIAYCEWKAGWWKEQRICRTSHGKDILHGVQAYAAKQAYFCKEMAQNCASHWLPALHAQGLSPVWESHYVAATGTEAQEKSAEMDEGDISDESDESDDSTSDDYDSDEDGSSDGFESE